MIEKDLNELAENFDLFDDWEDRYRYLIDLGKKLPAMDEALKTEDTLVRGCTSRVWLVAEVRDDIYHFSADSDAQIVKGLIYILMVAYQDKSLSEIASVDIESSFKTLGLNEHLSPSRRNGFFSIVERIRSAS